MNKPVSHWCPKCQSIVPTQPQTSTGMVCFACQQCGNVVASYGYVEGRDEGRNMLISDLIEVLQQIAQNHGDVEVYLGAADYAGPVSTVSFNRDAEPYYPAGVVVIRNRT